MITQVIKTDETIMQYTELPRFRRVLQIIMHGWKNYESIKTEFEYYLLESLLNRQINHFDNVKKETMETESLLHSAYGDLVLSHFVTLFDSGYRTSDRFAWVHFKLSHDVTNKYVCG